MLLKIVGSNIWNTNWSMKLLEKLALHHSVSMDTLLGETVTSAKHTLSDVSTAHSSAGHSGSLPMGVQLCSRYVFKPCGEGING